MRLSLFAVTTVTVFSASFAAYAATITSYNSQTAFNAVSTTITNTIPTPVGGASTQIVFSPYTIGPVTFSDPVRKFVLFNDGLYGIGQTYLGVGNILGSVETLGFGSATAVSLEIGTLQAADTLTFGVDGSVFNFTTPDATSPIFVGFTSTIPLTSLSITDINDAETDILNFQLGSAATPVSITPEPSSILLLATGLLGVAGIMRRRFV